MTEWEIHHRRRHYQLVGTKFITSNLSLKIDFGLPHTTFCRGLLYLVIYIIDL